MTLCGDVGATGEVCSYNAQDWLPTNTPNCFLSPEGYLDTTTYSVHAPEQQAWYTRMCAGTIVERRRLTETVLV